MAFFVYYRFLCVFNSRFFQDCENNIFTFLFLVFLTKLIFWKKNVLHNFQFFFLSNEFQRMFRITNKVMWKKSIFNFSFIKIQAKQKFIENSEIVNPKASWGLVRSPHSGVWKNMKNVFMLWFLWKFILFFHDFKRFLNFLSIYKKKIGLQFYSLEAHYFFGNVENLFFFTSVFFSWFKKSMNFYPFLKKKR